MCRTLTSTIKNCENNIGSLKQIWITRTDFKGTKTSSANLVISNLNLTGGAKMTEMLFVKGSGSYSCDLKIDNVGIQEWTHSVTFKVNKRVVENHSAMLSLIDGNKDLIVLVLDFQNQYRLLGWDYGLSIDQLSGGIGASKNAGSSYDITLNGIQRTPEYLVNKSAALNVLS